MKRKQNLYLVFGGYLKKIGKEEFSSENPLEYKGIYDSLEEAKKHWKAISIKNIDIAKKKFKIVPLFNLFDPSEKIIDYINKLRFLKVKIDDLTFNTSDNLYSVAEKLKANNAGAGVIIDKKKLCGIVTERDIVKAITAKEKKILNSRISTFMTKDVVFVNTEQTIIEAIEILRSNGFRHLPIYDEKKLQLYGILSYKDFMLGDMY